MASRGRTPKNGTPYDRLLKAHCQKGVAAASKSAGVVGKWGSASFTSLRAASGSDQPARPKKFFKSKNSSDPEPPQAAPVPSAPASVEPPRQSKFFKSKSQPVAAVQPPPPPPPQTPEVAKPKPEVVKKALRPLDVGSNTQESQPVQSSNNTDALKVPPLKLRLKAGALTQPPPPPQPTKVPEEEPEVPPSPEAPTSGSDQEESDSEISFKEPSLVVKSPVKSPVTSPSSAAASKPEVSVSPPPVKSLSRSNGEHQRPSRLTAPEPEPEPARKPEVRSYSRRGAAAAASSSVKPDVTVVVEPSPKDSSSEGEPVSKRTKMADETPSTTKSIPDPGPPLPKPNPLMPKAASVASDSKVSEELFAAPRPKKSIFKSKSQAGSSSGSQKRGLALYKNKFSAHQEEKEEEEQLGDFKARVLHQAITVGAKSSMDFDDDFDDHPSDMTFSMNKMTRVTSEAASRNPDETMQEVVSVKCNKAQKEYFTVIKNVRGAHQIQDDGEFDEFNDEVEYILEGLAKSNNLQTRCLSTVQLATKCMEPPFRMHLRAHGTMTKFLAELKDAPSNASLALCTSTVLFVLSQDRLNMDMDRDSLELMLNLLDTDSRIKDALEGSGLNKKELEKNKSKVMELVAAMKKKGHARNLSLEHISADHLSMETLLSLTSKRAGEWFKEELRELGGLDHLVQTMADCLGFLTADEISMWTDPLHNKLKKASRVLKVLESVTHENEENCQYLLDHKSGHFLDLIHKLFKLLDEEVPLNPNRDINDKECVAATLRESLFDVMRVYINLVHDYQQKAFGSKLAGQKENLFDMVLHCLFVIPNYLPVEKRFDVLVLTLTLLINLVEHCEPNRRNLLKTKVPMASEDMFSVTDQKMAAEGLVQLFLEKEENARWEESKADAILDDVKDEDAEAKEKEEKAAAKSSEDDRKKTEQEVIDETVAKLLQKAGRHMEDTLIASYITLIVGYLILDDKEHESQIRSLLPDANFSTMAAVLKKFFNFMNLTASSTVSSNRGLKATETVLKYLEKIDKSEEEQKAEDKKLAAAGMGPGGSASNETFSDLTLFDVTADQTTLLADSTSASGPNFDMDNDFDKL